MSNQDMGGNLGNIDKSQIQALLGSLGAQEAGKTSEAQTTVKTGKSQGTQDTKEKSETTTKSSGLLAGEPRLPKPNQRTMNEPGTGESFSGHAAATQSTATLKEADSIGDQIDAVAEEYPSIRLLVKTVGSDEEGMKLFHEALEELGISMPVNVSDPKLSKAIEKALVKHLQENGVPLAENRAAAFTASLDQGLKTMTDFADFLTAVDPTGKSLNHGEGLRKVEDIVGSAQELIDGVLEQLNNMPGADNKQGTLEFMKYISEVIAELRLVLTELHLKDSEKSGEMGRALQKSQSDKRAALFDRMRVQDKMRGLSKIMNEMQDAMRIITPIMTAAMILTSLVFLPVAPYVTVIMITIAITQLAVMTTLTETGAMKEMFEFANEVIGSVGGKIFSALGIDWKGAEDFSKIFVWAVAIASLVAITALLVLVPQVGMMIPMVALPIITTMITQSQLIETILDAFASVVSMSDTVKAILTGVITMVATLVISLGIELLSLVSPVKLIQKAVSYLFTGGVGIIATAAEVGTKAAMTTLRTIMAAIRIVVTLVKKVLDAIKIVSKPLAAALRNIQNLTKSAARIIQEKVRSILDFIVKVLFKFDKFVDKILDPLKRLANSTTGSLRTKMKNLNKLIDENREILTKIATKAASVLRVGGEVTSSGVKGTMAVGQGAISKKLAELTEEEGELDYIIELLSEIIKALESLLASLKGKSGGEGVGEFMKQINELTSLFETIVASMSGINEDLASSLAA